MARKHIPLLLLAFLLIPLAHASSWCYQETANVSTGCGGLNTGNYTSDMGSLWYDGNWSSYSGSSGGTRTGFVNYTKPANAQSTSLWQVKDGDGLVNLTINASCWSYSQTALFLKVTSYINAAPCLEPNTSILLDTGQVPIKDAKAGDKAYSYANGTLILSTITSAFNLTNPYSYLYIIHTASRSIKATANHQFYSDGHYVPAENLRVGMNLLASNLSAEQIVGIEVVSYAGEVWDLEVNNTHNFFANNLLVHNNADNNYEWSCYNGSGYMTMRTNSNGDSATQLVYEEAMWWDISEAGIDYNISSPRAITSSGSYNVNGSFSGTGNCLNVTASDVTIAGNGKQINCTVLVSGAHNVTISNLIIDPAVGLLVNNTNDSVFANLTLLDITQYGIYVTNNSNRNNFTNITVVSASGTLLQITDTSAGNIFRWNNFTGTTGLYVNDTAGGNFYNGTIGGKNEGNIWANVLNGSVEVKGSVGSGLGGGLYIGGSGAGYPYNNSTSLGKLYGNVVDYAPLTGLLNVSAGMGGATATLVGNSRWEQLFTGNATITPQGGNITKITHPATLQLTDRWALFFGNMSGNITLGSSESARVYEWLWSPVDNGGSVCTTTGSTYNFFSIGGATGAEIDTAWGFDPEASDNGVSTFINGSCSVNLSQSSATAANRSKTGPTMPDDAFYTCPLKSPAATTVSSGEKEKLAFCSPIIGASGKNYLNETVDYELIVPTPYAVGGAGVDVYYFYAVLN